MAATGGAGKIYGVAPFEFIEPGLVFLDAT